jgi:hypothetical protein
VATPEYSVRVNEFLDTTDFGIGSHVADLEGFRNLAYAEYINQPGEMFFSFPQSHPKASLLRDLMEVGGHLRIYRGTDNVWSGWLAETDESSMDAVLYGYDYLSGLFKLHTDWAEEWTTATLDEIATDVWDAAVARTKSRMGWMTTGTIEVPVTTSGGATPYEQGLYTTYYKRILFVLQEITAAGMSDTTNRGKFEITPAGVFNFWKDFGSELETDWMWGDPRIMSYRRFNRFLDRSNKILGVGSTPRDVVQRYTAEDAASQAVYGLAEDAVYLQWARDEDEVERAIDLRLAKALRVDAELALTFMPGTLVPYRATSASFQVGDQVGVTISNGVSLVNSEDKIIVGQQVLLHRGEEIVRPMLADRL